MYKALECRRTFPLLAMFDGDCLRLVHPLTKQIRTFIAIGLLE